MLPADSFATRLDAALATSPYTLTRLHQKLAASGTPVSTSTLSQWRTGRTTPTRRTALDAVATLEGLLGTPKGHLIAASTDRARRSERWWRQPAGIATWDVDERLRARLLRDFGEDPHTVLHCRGRHEMVQVDELGRLTSSRCTLVMQVADPSARRVVIGSRSSYRDDTGVILHSPAVIHGGKLGRVGVYREDDMTVFEVLLVRPYQRDDVVVLEYELTPERLAERSVPEAEG